jgi:Uma2 family endonuclease
MYAMAGAGETHNVLVTNLARSIANHLPQKPCKVWVNGTGVQVTATAFYTYPDVVVICGERRLSARQRDTLLNPSIIFEVLSPSTESYDGGRKFDMYRTTESLREYVLVSSDRMHVDRYVRQSSGEWLLSAVDGPGDTLRLESIEMDLPMPELYAKVEFPEPTLRAGTNAV